MNSQNPLSGGHKSLNVVITGASRGIGNAIAEKFGAEGHNLFLCSSNEAQLFECVEYFKLKYSGITVSGFAADLSDKKSTSNFGKWVNKNCSPVNILINNAGRFLPGSIYNEEEGVLQKMIEVNLYSAYNLTRSLLPKMMEKKEGHIFNICSIASLQAYSNGGAYSISKFALMGFNKNLRQEMMPYNIKVTAIYPGAVFTESWAATGIDPHRIMETKDIAEAIYSAAMLSPQACVEDIVLRPQQGDLP